MCRENCVMDIIVFGRDNKKRRLKEKYVGKWQVTSTTPCWLRLLFNYLFLDRTKIDEVGRSRIEWMNYLEQRPKRPMVRMCRVSVWWPVAHGPHRLKIGRESNRMCASLPFDTFEIIWNNCIRSAQSLESQFLWNIWWRVAIQQADEPSLF